MAVPKRKTTRSRAGKRRSHIRLSSKNIIEDKKSGEYRLSHHIDLLVFFLSIYIQTLLSNVLLVDGGPNILIISFEFDLFI